VWGKGTYWVLDWGETEVQIYNMSVYRVEVTKTTPPPQKHPPQHQPNHPTPNTTPTTTTQQKKKKKKNTHKNKKKKQTNHTTQTQKHKKKNDLGFLAQGGKKTKSLCCYRGKRIQHSDSETLRICEGGRGEKRSGTRHMTQSEKTGPIR